MAKILSEQESHEARKKGQRYRGKLAPIGRQIIQHLSGSSLTKVVSDLGTHPRSPWEGVVRELEINGKTQKAILWLSNSNPAATVIAGNDLRNGELLNLVVYTKSDGTYRQVRINECKKDSATLRAKLGAYDDLSAPEVSIPLQQEESTGQRWIELEHEHFLSYRFGGPAIATALTDLIAGVTREETFALGFNGGKGRFWVKNQISVLIDEQHSSPYRYKVESDADGAHHSIVIGKLHELPTAIANLTLDMCTELDRCKKEAQGAGQPWGWIRRTDLPYKGDQYYDDHALHFREAQETYIDTLRQTWTLIQPLSQHPYTLFLRGVGNPDHGQYSDVAPPESVGIASPGDAPNLCRAYIREWGLGGGNWGGGRIVDRSGKLVASVSYNGQLWDANGLAIDPAELHKFLEPTNHE